MSVATTMNAVSVWTPTARMRGEKDARRPSVLGWNPVGVMSRGACGVPDQVGGLGGRLGLVS
ncbi:MAG: hypothetical protein AVDCRST_MAG19-2640 [uncultured Thermomicrobiales bacterium]|uniref:Uncharacterized protein n=1 Tax=uncultured Thermomicrobiales bacterium TaxID=1645740 RepID=A0A6J4V614_9BACT|nr:MAG: hypothetical protein AVDCRST_MAG19-2640 [uncultured Thermomicrobiales bacterium]